MSADNEAGGTKPPASVIPVVGATTCPRCGKVAAARGHPEFGEWLDCYERYLLEHRLPNWTAQYRSRPAPNPASA